MQPNRIPPNLPAHLYQTFSVAAPLATHFRPAGCEEVRCEQYAAGWRSIIDEATTLGLGQAYYIRHDAGRSYTEAKLPDGRTEFTFRAGQPCFAEHRTRVERPEIYTVRGGDWRGDPLRAGVRTHTRPEFWVEEFAEHQQGIADAHERG